MRTTSTRPSPDPHRSQHVRRWRSVSASLWWRLNSLAAATYLGAASLIGFEALALVLGFRTAWPIAIPIVVGLLALLFYARRFVRRIWSVARSTGDIDAYSTHEK